MTTSMHKLQANSTIYPSSTNYTDRQNMQQQQPLMCWRAPAPVTLSLTDRGQFFDLCRLQLQKSLSI